MCTPKNTEKQRQKPMEVLTEAGIHSPMIRPVWPVVSRFWGFAAFQKLLSQWEALFIQIRDLPGRDNHRMPPDGTLEEKFALRHKVTVSEGGPFHQIFGATGDDEYAPWSRDQLPVRALLWMVMHPMAQLRRSISKMRWGSRCQSSGIPNITPQMIPRRGLCLKPLEMRQALGTCAGWGGHLNRPDPIILERRIVPKPQEEHQGP